MSPPYFRGLLATLLPAAGAIYIVTHPNIRRKIVEPATTTDTKPKIVLAEAATKARDTRPHKVGRCRCNSCEALRTLWAWDR